MTATGMPSCIQHERDRLNTIQTPHDAVVLHKYQLLIKLVIYHL